MRKFYENIGLKIMELMKILVKEGKMIYKQLDPENNFYEILKYLSYVN